MEITANFVEQNVVLSALLSYTTASARIDYHLGNAAVDFWLFLLNEGSNYLSIITGSYKCLCFSLS